jgi:hypothetical protein
MSQLCMTSEMSVELMMHCLHARRLRTRCRSSSPRCGAIRLPDHGVGMGVRVYNMRGMFAHLCRCVVHRVGCGDANCDRGYSLPGPRWSAE